MKAYKGGKPDKQNEKTDSNLLRVIKETESKTGKKIVANDSEAKYSHMLLELIKPYHSNPPDAFEVEHLLQLATIAWNLANMKKLVPFAFKIMKEETKNMFSNNIESFRQVEKMLKEKTKRFDEYDLFIHEAKLNSTAKDGFFVTIAAKPLEAFLEEGLHNELEEGLHNEDDDDFFPGFIDRSAFTVTPKQAFYDWVKKAESDSLFPPEIPESRIYLIEEMNTIEEIQFWVSDNYERIFELELDLCFANKKKWPKKRTYELFSNWFDISYQTTIYDLENYRVNK